MGDDRRSMRPVHAGARLDMAFQIVGMQLDQAGDQQIPLAILTARNATCAHVGDYPVADQQMPLHGPVWQDKYGVVQDRFSHFMPLSGAVSEGVSPDCDKAAVSLAS